MLAISDAPNWAQTRFGLAENELELRILRGVLGCEHVGVSYLRFGPGWRLTVGHRHPGGGEEVGEGKLARIGLAPLHPDEHDEGNHQGGGSND